jgi:hypothetical protein
LNVHMLFFTDRIVIIRDRHLSCWWLYPTAQPYPRCKVQHAPSINMYDVNATSLFIKFVHYGCFIQSPIYQTVIVSFT